MKEKEHTLRSGFSENWESTAALVCSPFPKTVAAESLSLVYPVNTTLPGPKQAAESVCLSATTL